MINFNEFEFVDRSLWQKEAERLLKGKPLIKLNWQYEPDIALAPYYDKNDVAGLNISTLESKGGSGGFRLIELLGLNSHTNSRSQNALNMGAEGVLVESGSSLEDYTDMSAIWPEHCWFGFIGDDESISEVNAFFESRNSDKADFHGFVGTRWLTESDAKLDFEVSIEKIFESTRSFSAYDHIRTIEVPLHLFQKQGSSITLELSILLGLLKTIIENAQDQNIAIGHLANKIQISTAVGTDFYHETAKIRAIRILAFKLFRAYDIPCHPEDFSIVGRTSSVVESALDADTNYLRKTTQALSIVFGTADLLIVTPFESQGYNEDARRITRNIGNLIKEETYGHWVQDPLAGSYFVESLTEQLCAASWERFRAMEEQGGCVAWIRDGRISSLIREDQHRVWKDVNSRRKTLVGVNNYPNSMEDPLLEELESGFRYGSKIEELRYQLHQSIKTGKLKKQPEVLPITVGSNAAMITARLNFASNFLGCAGFKFLKEVSDQQATESTADVIVVCGGDDDYAELAQSQIDAWHQKSQLVILAGNPSNADGLKEMGIDTFIHMKSEILETNLNILKKLKLI